MTKEGHVFSFPMNRRQAGEGDLGQMVATQTQHFAQGFCAYLVIKKMSTSLFTGNKSINQMQKDQVMDLSQN